MLIKFITSIICIVTIMISSETLKDTNKIKKVYQNTVIGTENNVIVEESINVTQEIKNETVEQKNDSTIKEANEIQKKSIETPIESNTSIQIDNKKEVVTITNTKKEKSEEVVKEKSNQEKEQKEETKEEPKKEQTEEQKKEESTETIKKDVHKEKTDEVKKEAKEEYIYNDTETKKIIADINEIAKRNPELWNKDNEKLYKIEISSSLVGQNYMSPYKKSQVEGIVLNVYPVKFLVYAIDYKRTGFTTETRYYIDITEY